MATLNREPNIADADGVYQKLIDAESMALNARLILLLINHVGDKAVVSEAIDVARRQDRRLPII
jgi:hypothetical protein